MTVCAVCNKTLRNPLSVSRGTGPVCAKNVKKFLDALTRPDAGTALNDWASVVSGGERQRVGLNRAALDAARSQFQARIHRQEAIPVATGTMENVYSATRQTSNEDVEFNQFENGAVIAHSRSNHDYVVVADRDGLHALNCSCWAHQRTHQPCRHMRAYEELAAQRRAENAGQGEQATTATATAEPTTTAEPTQTQEPAPAIPPVSEPTEQASRIIQVPAIIRTAQMAEYEAEFAREQNLANWHERHAHDGVFVSENEEAWQTLLSEARGNMGEYETENVLDGSNNTFGIELEFQGARGNDVARALYDAGLADTSSRMGYLYRQSAGQWVVKSDGSVDNGSYGGEIVSPVLRDTPETWAAIERVSNILNHNGASTSNDTGFHIHMGNEPLDDRGYRWQRLARQVYGFQNDYFRMGAASQESGVTAHRGTYYTGPLRREDLVKLSKNDTGMEASKKLIGYTGHRSRYKLINTAKYVENQVPTVEFRYPNSTTSATVIQRQVQLANATIMQAAYLRKGMPGSDRMPKLFRWDDTVMTGNESSEQRFRMFLDTLGSHRLRVMATQLWLRGRY